MKRYCRLFFFAYLYVWAISLYAQKPQSTIKLTDYLQTLEQRFNSSFSYNPTVLEAIVIAEPSNCESLSACLEQLRQRVPFDFKNSNGSILVIPKRYDVTFKVLDAETQEALTYLFVKTNSGATSIIYSDEESFSLNAIFPLDTITLSATGYKSMDVLGSELKQLKVPLQMQFGEITLDAVLISQYLTRGIDAKIADHSFVVDMKNLGILAGEVDGDVYNLIKNIPGIHAPDGKPGNLNFRGSPFDQNLIEIDDITIYHQGHFLGTISPYNTLILDNITIDRNVLHPKYGGRVGGLLKMETINKAADSAKYKVAVNTLYTGASANIPIVKNKLGLALTARSNYSNFASPKLEQLSALNFQGSQISNVSGSINSSNDSISVRFFDINAKLIYNISPKHKASISFLTINNDASIRSVNGIEEMGAIDPDYEQDFQLDNWGVTGKLESQFTNKFSGVFKLSHSSYMLNNFENRYDPSDERSHLNRINTIKDFQWVSEFDYDIDDRFKLEFGYSLTHHKLDLFELFIATNNTVTIDESAILNSAFVNVQNTWNKKLILNLGLHTDYYIPTKKVYIDPRFSASYLLNNELTLKGATGRSHQYIQQRLRTDFDDFRVSTQSWLLADENLPTLESYQSMLGAIYSPSSWLFDVEFFLKNTTNITQDVAITDRVPGSLRNIGVDVFIKKRWGKLETWMGYTLSKSTIDFLEESPALFNQRHVLNITGILNLKQWNFATTWNLASGLPVEIPEIIAQNPDIFVPYTDRFPIQHQLDFSSTYTFTNSRKTWKSTVGLSLINIYDQENIINIFQRATSRNNLYRTALRFSPNLQFNISF